MRKLIQNSIPIKYVFNSRFYIIIHPIDINKSIDYLVKKYFVQ